jgi:hypothetical protein
MKSPGLRSWRWLKFVLITRWKKIELFAAYQEYCRVVQAIYAHCIQHNFTLVFSKCSEISVYTKKPLLQVIIIIIIVSERLGFCFYLAYSMRRQHSSNSILIHNFLTKHLQKFHDPQCLETGWYSKKQPSHATVHLSNIGRKHVAWMYAFQFYLYSWIITACLGLKGAVL